MTKLNQIIAIEKGVKTDAANALTQAYHGVQKAPQLSGIARTYQPRDDEGEQLPSESTRVQIRTGELIGDVRKALTRMFDVVATKDQANTAAKADIVVDGVTLAKDVPATYLLFLEKQLVDLATFVRKLPVLDPAEVWTWSDQAGAYATDPVKTTRTKKVPRNHVKAEATDKHPAQVEVYHEDVIVGYWTTVKFSGAIPAKQVADMLERVGKLSEAVKKAREEANGITVTDVNVGNALLGYVFS
ncbi:hypothetical protein [Allorhizocola rhizosphaerae]|uniref:DUF7873 family protein n=1 Tax=Allorhizocola rhizosphaerae TaxID=1872709 RepID=UPI000E3C47DE|nr:hypothetical protein [Allorhizocola rhizosphaerae]